MKFKMLIEDRGLGHVRACADDIGAAIKSLHVLPLLASIFKDAEDYAGLKLKLKKTNFVPLNVELCDAAIATIHSWIRDHVPQWIDVQIVSCARYLGVFLGPKSATSSWTSPLEKWRNRATTIAAAGAPVGFAVEMYNSRALTTLSYVAQVAKLPEKSLPRERALLGRLLHLPGNAMSSSDIFALHKWGSYQVKSAEAISLARLMRSALTTLTTWSDMYDMLAQHAENHLGALQTAVLKQFKPPHWDSPSFAEVLHDAATGIFFLEASSGCWEGCFDRIPQV